MSNSKPVSARSKSRRLTLRITTDAMLVAMYFVLARFVSIDLPLAQFSISSLPIILCGFLFGPVDTLAVSLLGSFLEQALSQYGLAVTTPLWMAPVVLLGLFVSLCAWLCRYEPKAWQVITITIIAELLFTAANTAALYLDGMIFQYEVKALHLLLPGRLLTAGLRMIVTVPLMALLLEPIKGLADKNGQITAHRPDKREQPSPQTLPVDEYDLLDDWQKPYDGKQ